MTTLQRPGPSTKADSPHGVNLFNRPALNKGTAFMDDERTQLGLHGLLPPQVEGLDEQVLRAYEAYRRKDDDLERHIYSRPSGHQRNPLLPAPPGPHRGDDAHGLHARGRGGVRAVQPRLPPAPRLVPLLPAANSLPALLRNRPDPEVDVIVFTDGEPIWESATRRRRPGHPHRQALPLHADRRDPPGADAAGRAGRAGTNKAERLSDPEYLGWLAHERVTGQAYFDFVDRFVRAVQQELPNVCLQREDFATPHARPILERYKDEQLTFNDDIQGMAAVTLGAILGAVGVTGKRLRDQQIVFLGAGSAAVGVADYLRAALVKDGLSEAERVAGSGWWTRTA